MDPKLQPYHAKALELLNVFDSVSLEHIPREENSTANSLASSISFPYQSHEQTCHVSERVAPSAADRRFDCLTADIEAISPNDWRKDIFFYIQNPSTANRPFSIPLWNLFRRFVTTLCQPSRGRENHVPSP